MKKNITINLFGSLYAIDEDAYELLEKYLDNTKRYFSKRDGGDEIADDIEHRVAELFAEMRSTGAEAINIENVQKIIQRIGNPEEMDDNEELRDEEHEHNSEYTGNSDSNDHYRKYFGGRRLYRNPDKQIVGGVLSGLCTYFGGNDPLPWRLIFVILAIFTQVIPFFILYLILWAVIPMAVTSEDKLKMKGKPVNMNTLNEEIMTDSTEATQGKMMSIFNTMITIIGFCLKLFFGFLICACLLGLLVIVFGLIQGFITPISLSGFGNISDSLVSEFVAQNKQILVYTWISVISAILFFSSLLYSIIHSIVKKNNNVRMSAFARISLIVITIASLCTGIGFGIATVTKVDEFADNVKRAQHTVDGVYLEDNQHQMLAAEGWEIMCYENASDNLYRSVRSFYDDDKTDYCMSFRRNNSQQPMNINLRRAEYYPEGYYHIEAIVSAKSNGAYVYAKNDSVTLASVMIPVDDSRGRGNMQSMEEDELRKTSFFNIDSENELWYDNDFYECISYWSFVKSETFHHTGGPLNYGITNIGTVIGREEDKIPAWRFSLRELKIVEDKK